MAFNTTYLEGRRWFCYSLALIVYVLLLRLSTHDSLTRFLIFLIFGILLCELHHFITPFQKLQQGRIRRLARSRQLVQNNLRS